MLTKVKTILVTGGTGSFGSRFIRRILDSYPNIERIVIYSRDELKQWQMSNEFGEAYSNRLRFFLGDVRDADRLQLALEGIDIVVHAAALKQVPAAEYNPMEFIKTNVLGADNLVQACLRSGVKKVVALSTDKAAAPINLYGATKLCSDKLFVAANNIVGSRNLSFSVVRYGNVMGSRGSVIPLFLNQAQQGILSITNTEMTRFNISLDSGVDMVNWAIEHSIGGEIFVPKIPSYKVVDVAEAIAPSCEKVVVGVRPGEKLHEEMVTESDSFSTIDLDNYYAILPTDGRLLAEYKNSSKEFSPVPPNWRYSSGNNTHFLTVEEIRGLIKKHIDPNFLPV